jgi:hypothetical protein
MVGSAPSARTKIEVNIPYYLPLVDVESHGIFVIYEPPSENDFLHLGLLSMKNTYGVHK